MAKRRPIGLFQRFLALALVGAGLLALGGRTAAGDASVYYPAGWSLIAAPAGTVLPADGPLYTLQPGDAAYETVPAGAGVQGGQGYWAYFSAGTTVTLPPADAGEYQTDAPAGVWFIVGNPSTSPARLRGADAAYTYDPANGYTPVELLPPWRGAFVYAVEGGTITLSPAADTIRSVPITPAAAAVSAAPSAVATSAMSPAASSVLVLASGFGQSRAGGPVGAGVLLRNSGSMAIGQTPVSMTVYGADGSVIATGDVTLRLLAAGATTGIVKRLSVSNSSAEAVRISVEAGDGRPAGDPPPGSLGFSQIALTPGRSGIEASAILTSSFATDQTNVHINALVYDANGSIIGGGAITRRLAPAGASIGVLVPVDISGTPARVEFYAQLP